MNLAFLVTVRAMYIVTIALVEEEAMEAQYQNIDGAVCSLKLVNYFFGYTNAEKQTMQFQTYSFNLGMYNVFCRMI